mgnify:CR=1 FL=1
MGYAQGLTPGVDPVLMPALGAATLACLAIATLAQDGTRERLVGGIAFALLGVALLSRVVHPWYVVPVLAFGVAARSPSILLASLLVPLSYLRYDPIGHEEPWVIAAQFVPVFLALAVEGAVRLGGAPRLSALHRKARRDGDRNHDSAANEGGPGERDDSPAALGIDGGRAPPPNPSPSDPHPSASLGL